MYYHARAKADKPFPVPDDFFGRVELDATRLNELRDEASKALKDAAAECARGTFLVDCKPWALHTEYEGLKHFQRIHPTKPSATVGRIIGSVDGHFRDLARFFRSETRDEYVAVQKKLFSYTVDAAVLHTVPQQSQHHTTSSIAYEGIKWAAYEPFLLRFRMDTVHFESMGVGIDDRGKSYAYRVIIPVTIPQAPEFFQTKRCMRVESASVMILKPSPSTSTRTEVFIAMQNDFKSNHVTRSMYKRFLMSLHKISSFIDAPPALETDSFISKVKWISGGQEGQCSVCTKTFSIIRSKYDCTVCGQHVCRKCLVMCSAVPQTQFLGLNRTRSASYKLCSTCINGLREDMNNSTHDTPVLGGEKPAFPLHKTYNLESSGLRLDGSGSSGGSAVILGNSNILGQSDQSVDGIVLPPAKSTNARVHFEGEAMYDDRMDSISTRDSSVIDSTPRAEHSPRTSVVSAFEILEDEVVYVNDDFVVCVDEDEDLLSNSTFSTFLINPEDLEEEEEEPRQRNTVIAEEVLEGELVFVDDENVFCDIQEEEEREEEEEEEEETVSALGEEPKQALAMSMMSTRSTVEIDTSEMMRIRRDIDLDDMFQRNARAVSTPGVIAEDMFESIHTSIQEQELLLQKLQRAYRTQSCA